eukprot:TCALIF_07530-PA protein Name:"Similar to SLC35G1 Solute carrier family 35 member G1 (Homo sapiens)" AED:0.08 eAED:0.08 QI:0/1/0.6/1/1/1/5/61/373
MTSISNSWKTLHVIDHFRQSIQTCFRPIFGVLIVFMSAFMFSTTNVMVKAVDRVDPFTIAFFRFLGILFPAISVILYQNNEFFPKGHRKMLITRSILGSTNLLIHFFALKHMPIADVNMAAAAAPALTVLFGRIFLKEKIIILDGINLILVVFGVILIIKPPFIFGYGPEYQRDPKYYTAAISVSVGCILQANVYIALRMLKSVPFASVLFVFGLIGAMESAIGVLLFATPCMPACGSDRVYMVAVGFLSFLAQIGLTVALKFEGAGLTSILRKAFDIFFSFVFQITIFNDIPGIFSVLGAILISIVIIGSGIKKIVDSLSADHWIKVDYLATCYPPQNPQSPHTNEEAPTPIANNGQRSQVPTEPQTKCSKL